MKINTPANTKTVILNIASNNMIELKNAVNEAKIKLGLSNSELSKLIGHSRNYISETLRIGASTEKQAEVISKIKEAVAVELVSRGVCGVSSSIERSQDVTSDFVRKDYHEQEINILKNSLSYADGAFEKQFDETKKQEQLKLDCEEIIRDQDKEIRRLNSDLAIANRDKNFMKKKLQDKNAVINWLVVSVVFILFLLTVKCAGWV